jgi:hypothetical protein
MSAVDAAHKQFLVGNLLELTHQLQLWYICEAQAIMDAEGTPCLARVAAGEAASTKRKGAKRPRSSNNPQTDEVEGSTEDDASDDDKKQEGDQPSRSASANEQAGTQEDGVAKEEFS